MSIIVFNIKFSKTTNSSKVVKRNKKPWRVHVKEIYKTFWNTNKKRKH